MKNLNGPLEAFSGTWGILVGFCVVFMLVHLVRSIRIENRMHWGNCIRDLPPGTHLVIWTTIAFSGIGLSRFAIWYWRFTTHGDYSRMSEIAIMMIVASVVGCIGFLGVLSAVTAPMAGRWPVLMAIFSVIAYWLSFLMRA